MKYEKNKKIQRLNKKKNKDIQNLKESYKIGKEYYENIENKIEKIRK